jgi:hypothetical protein
VRIEGQDRAGLERLLRYRARPPLALERLEQLRDDQLIYRLPKPQADGATQLALTPFQLIDRLAALIPPARVHRHWRRTSGGCSTWRVRCAASSAKRSELTLRGNALRQEEITEEIEVILRSAAVNALR